MRKLLVLVLAAILIFTFAATVSAAEASALNATAGVSSDGSCHINMTITLRTDGTSDKLLFPLPAGASGVRVNGRHVSSSREGDVINLNLSRFVRGVNGDVSVNIQYSLHGLVTETENGTLKLQLPLLSGFNLPISNMELTVNLPGPSKYNPSFTSGYHQAAIEQHLEHTLEGNTIKCKSLKAMKDHETLVMTMPVDEDMFPRVVIQTESATAAWIGLGICAGLAFVYWLLFLRTLPLRKRCSEAPEGFNAGQMGCILGSGGVDLTMMVFTWAQLGYVMIQPQRGKVLLHRRMEMGNERSELEQRAFRTLFGGRRMVDATGSRYATLAAQLATKPAGVRELYRKASGSPMILRVLCAGIGLFGGAGIGAVMGSGAALQWFLIILMGILGAVSGYMIPGWTDNGLLRNKRSLYGSLTLCIIWIILALISKTGNLGFAMTLLLLFFGILYGLSGLRTDLGKRTAGQVLGLRHYLLGGDKAQLRHACECDPDYFFRLAPYAIALGVGKAFAKAVGREKLERCPYLATDGNMSASLWMIKLESIVATMDARKQNRYLEKLQKIIHQLTRP